MSMFGKGDGVLKIERASSGRRCAGVMPSKRMLSLMARWTLSRERLSRCSRRGLLVR